MLVEIEELRTPRSILPHSSPEFCVRFLVEEVLVLWEESVPDSFTFTTFHMGR